MAFEGQDDSSGIYLHGRESLPEASQREASSPEKLEEWVPWTLRKRSATAFSGVLWTSAIALQVLDLKIRSVQGISIGNSGALIALRYLPTVIAILLGFWWKALVNDLKKITPWAAMSNTWKPATQSLSLNYIDQLDLHSAYTAARLRQWPLLLVILGGLLSGALVPFANGLSYVNLRASFSREITLRQSTAFDLNNTLTMPVDYRSTLPLTASTNQFIVTNNTYNNFLPWTYGAYAFQSFELPRHDPESVIRAEVMAFTSSLTCVTLNYAGVFDNNGPNSTVTIRADGSGQQSAGCLEDIVQAVKQPYNTSSVASYFGSNAGSYYAGGNSVVPPTAWLNVTECGKSGDYRILVTVMRTDLSTTRSANNTTPTDVKVSTAGLICEPQYYVVPATVDINTTTAKVVGFNTTENRRTSIDIGTSTLIMQAQLEGPFEDRSAPVFQAAATNQWSSTVLPNSYDWAVFPQLDVMQKWSWLYLWDLNPSALPTCDTFFALLVGLDPSRVLELIDNVDELYTRVNDLFGRSIAQIAHLFARRPQSGYLEAVQSSQGSRIFIRESSLRVIQAFLTLLGGLVLLCATFARPKTCLIEDPGSIASISVLLSTNQGFESFISSNILLNDNMNKGCLSNVLCRLRQSAAGLPELQFIYRQRGEHASGSSVAGQVVRSVSEQPLTRNASASRSKLPRKWFRSCDLSHNISPDSGYRPIALRTYSRAALLCCVIGLIIALIALLVVSRRHNGFRAITQASQAAWSYVPTVILVLVGYGIQSLETSAFTLEKYWTLRNNKTPGHKVILPTRLPIKARLSPLNRRSFALLTALICSSTVYPALKIVAAGLYQKSFFPRECDIVLDTDISSILGLEEFIGEGREDGAEQTAHWLGKQVSRELQPGFNNPQPQNIVGNIVTPMFWQNLTNYLDTDASRDLSTSKITMDSFGVQTDVNCRGFDQTEFALTLKCNGNGVYVFTFACASLVCHQNFGNILSQLNVSFTHDDTSQEPADAFFMTASPDRKDASLAVLLADFSSLTGSLPQISSLCSNNGPRTVDATDLGSLYPTIRGVNCFRTMNKVNISITMQPAPSGVALLNQGGGQESWWTTDYDKESLRTFSKINPPLWPYILLSNGGKHIIHQGATISPVIGFWNILSLIAQAQLTDTENQKDLLNVSNLVKASQKVYAVESRLSLIYVLSSTQFKQVHNVGLNRYPPNTTMKAAASAITYQERVVQDTGTSIALVSLLAVILACLVFMSATMPRKTILSSAPSSIAGQMSLVAGSALVKRLRQEEARTTEDSNVWDDFFGLGWWPQLSQDEDVGTCIGNSMRWGIDTGALPDKRRGLREKPKGSEAVTSGSGYTPLELGDIGQFENPFEHGVVLPDEIR